MCLNLIEILENVSYPKIFLFFLNAKEKKKIESKEKAILVCDCKSNRNNILFLTFEQVAWLRSVFGIGNNGEKSGQSMEASAGFIKLHHIVHGHLLVCIDDGAIIGNLA